MGGTFPRIWFDGLQSLRGMLFLLVAKRVLCLVGIFMWDKPGGAIRFPARAVYRQPLAQAEAFLACLCGDASGGRNAQSVRWVGFPEVPLPRAVVFRRRRDCPAPQLAYVVLVQHSAVLSAFSGSCPCVARFRPPCALGDPVSLGGGAVLGMVLARDESRRHRSGVLLGLCLSPCATRRFRDGNDSRRMFSAPPAELRRRVCSSCVPRMSCCVSCHSVDAVPCPLSRVVFRKCAVGSGICVPYMGVRPAGGAVDACVRRQVADVDRQAFVRAVCRPSHGSAFCLQGCGRGSGNLACVAARDMRCGRIPGFCGFCRKGSGCAENGRLFGG